MLSLRVRLVLRPGDVICLVVIPFQAQSSPDEDENEEPVELLKRKRLAIDNTSIIKLLANFIKRH